jgi:glycosyltransferase involved in cell wall biosynthesis
MEPLVSVIVPAYNAERFLADTLRSVAEQTFREKEVIIVDDGSVDRTAEVAREYCANHPDARLVRQSNGGIGAARATGVRSVSSCSRYLIFLDSDDLLEPCALEVLTAYMDSNPTVGLVHFDCCCIDEHGQELSPEKIDFTPMSMPRYVPFGISARKLRREEVETPFVSIYNLAGMISSVSFVRRESFEQAGGWDPTFRKSYEDIDLWLRIALSCKVHYLPKSLSRYRRHQNQITNDIGSGGVDVEYQRLLAKWTNCSWLPSEQRATVQSAESFRRSGLGVYKNMRLSVQYARAGDFWDSTRHIYGALRYLLRVS